MECKYITAVVFCIVPLQAAANYNAASYASEGESSGATDTNRGDI